MGNLIIEEMIDYIIEIIEQKNIIKKENEKNLKLILISRIKTYSNIELNFLFLFFYLKLTFF